MSPDPVSGIDACIVMTTLPDQAAARQLARAVLTERLAACIQIQTVESHYWWDGKIESAPECLLFLKTPKSRADALMVYLSARHPYDTPEILQVPVTGGFDRYLAWMAAETVLPG